MTPSGGEQAPGLYHIAEVLPLVLAELGLDHDLGREAPALPMGAGAAGEFSSGWTLPPAQTGGGWRRPERCCGSK